MSEHEPPQLQFNIEQDIQPSQRAMKRVSFQMPEELHLQLEVAARLVHMSMAAIIRSAVQECLTRGPIDQMYLEEAQSALLDIEPDAGKRQAALNALFGNTTVLESKLSESDKQEE